MSDEEYTVFCRNLSENVTESLLYELFLQAGPVEDVRIPTQDGRNRNYGFVVYKHKCSVKYALDLFRDTKLFGRAIALQNRIIDRERIAEKMEMELVRRSEISSLRGGPSGNYPRSDDINALRGGSLSNNSRNDDISSLRGASVSYTRKDNMAPRGFADNPYKSFSPKSDNDFNSDPRYMNPYGSSFMNSYQAQDSRELPSAYRRRSPKDRNDRNNRDNSRFGRRDRDRDFSRRDNNYRSEKDQNRNNSRQRSRRSRSRDRSPYSHRNDRNRHR